MKVLIIDYPWKKTWLSLYMEAFAKRGHEVEVWDGKTNVRIHKPDLVLCTWADRDFTSLFPDARHSMMMRRFEFFHANWKEYNWAKIVNLICCNPWIAVQMSNAVKTKVHWICNPVDASKCTFKDREPGKKIGIVCRIHSVKNLPLALQIIKGLPGYELHIAGEINETQIVAYLQHLDIDGQIKFYGRVDNKNLDAWWEDKNYCLCTSISEGDPMFVLEACAKGIKPIIHNWPGADVMYPTSWVFDSAGMARQIMDLGKYDSKEYRDFVVEKRNVSLANKTVETVLGAVND